LAPDHLNIRVPIPPIRRAVYRRMVPGGRPYFGVGSMSQMYKLQRYRS